MCGIAGIALMPGVSKASALDAVRRMTARMHPRGPDANGEWAGEGVVLGHRRLAIIDLDARSTQPMASADGRYLIVFNGEIYNFRELRRELEADGVAFRTTSDTEVLLALFAREGERMLPRLRGMFAFAIWDTQTRELFLARDPYGIKPLYYARTNHGLIFASQVKALLASRRVSTEREPAGWAGFFLWGSVPEPWTLFRDIFALPAGHWLRVRSGLTAVPVSWHDVRTHWQGEGCKATAKQVRERVRQAVSWARKSRA
jgi:asparagine synthase (glutamine-hydrolysing)